MARGSLNKRLKTIVIEHDTLAGRSFDLFIQSLILISLITFSIESLPNLTAEISLYLSITEVLIVLVFSAEYLLRVYVAENKWTYVFSFYGVIDLVAILPFYLSMGIDLRSVRILRLFRLFRLFKLVKYNRALQRFGRAFAIAREEFFLFGVVTLMLLYLAAVGIYYFESQSQPEHFRSIFHSLWWAVTTLTTVGYGDVYPVTTGGRVFTFLVLMVGLGVVAIPAGLLASALTKARSEEDEL